MNIYTFYSESHRKLYKDYFLPSFNRHNVTKAKLNTSVCPQWCPTGEYASEGWVRPVDYKLSIILNAIRENMGRVFIYTDCDVTFHAPFVEDTLNELAGYDLCGMATGYADSNTICSGFYVCRANDSTLRLFRAIASDTCRSSGRDEPKLNELKDTVSWKLLPANKYFALAPVRAVPIDDAAHVWTDAPPERPYMSAYGLWNGNDNFDVPGAMVAFHANNAIGPSPKERLTQLVLEKYSRLKSQPCEGVSG